MFPDPMAASGSRRCFWVSDTAPGSLVPSAGTLPGGWWRASGNGSEQVAGNEVLTLSASGVGAAPGLALW
jgi:hypothetical protein